MIFKSYKERKQFLAILTEMTVKDIKARYKHAVLGLLWIIITPLLQMLIIATLFGYFLKNPVRDYYVFLFAGLIFWNFFSLSLSKASNSIVDQRALIQKAVFPRAVIPISIVLSNFFHFIVSVILLTFWVIIFGEINFIGFLLIPAALLWILILTVGCSLLVSGFNVRYRDISYFLSIILQILFYATPILYPITFIPDKLHYLFALNPLTGILQIAQFIYSEVKVITPDFVLSGIIISVTVLFFGWREFSRLSKSFDDWV